MVNIFRTFWEKGYLISRKKPRYDKEDLITEFKDNLFWILLNGFGYLGITIALLLSVILKSYIPCIIFLISFTLLFISLIPFYKKLYLRINEAFYKRKLFDVFDPTDRLIEIIRKTSYSIFFSWILVGIILILLFDFYPFVSIYWGMLVLVYLGVDRVFYPSIAIIYYISRQRHTIAYKKQKKLLWIFLILTTPIWYITTVLLAILLFVVMR